MEAPAESSVFDNSNTRLYNYSFDITWDIAIVVGVDENSITMNVVVVVVVLVNIITVIITHDDKVGN